MKKSFGASASVIILSSLLLVMSCATDSTYDSTKLYKKDIKLKINGQSGTGMMVIKRASKYDIQVEAKGKIDLFTLRNCHRSLESEKAWKNNKWLNKLNRKKARLVFKPNESIENNEYCPWDIGVWSISGRHSWAWVDIYTGNKYILKSVLKCNGTTGVKSGVSVCQAYIGTYQEVSFDTPVEILAGSERCDLGVKNGKVFRFKIRDDMCIYGFRDPITKTRHRLTTYGYNDIILKETK